jgi:hypothetical protein
VRDGPAIVVLRCKSRFLCRDSRSSGSARLTNFFLVLVYGLLALVYSPPSAKAASPSDVLAITKVTHSPKQPSSAVPVKIKAQVSGSPTSVTLEYQLVDPGHYIALKDPAFKSNWVSLAMSAEKTGKGVYSAILPAELQTNRRLVRYRVKAVDAKGSHTMSPEADDPVPNHAYFVYDGIPAWRGAIEPKSNDPKRSQPTLFDTNAMRRVQAFHLISRKASVENVTWREPAGGHDYKYTCTVVSDGVVF